MTHEELKTRIADMGYDSVTIFESPGYDDAFIGIDSNQRAVYDYELMVECLMREDGMSYDDAVDFIEYNTMRALPYWGDSAPVVVYSLFPGEDEGK